MENLTNHQQPYAQNKPLVIAITGASGVIYGLRLLQYLLAFGQKIEFVISSAGIRVLQEEHDVHLNVNDEKINVLKSLKLNCADVNQIQIHKLNDYGASIASGSHPLTG